MGKVFLSDSTWADFKTAWGNNTQPWKAGGDQIVADADAHISEIDTNGFQSVTDDSVDSGNHAVWDYDDDPDRNDYNAIQFAAGAVRTLAMAYSLTGTQNYADYAIDYLYHWCLQGYKDGATPATYMIPHADTARDDHTRRNTAHWMITLYINNSAFPYAGSFLLGNSRWTSAKGGSTPNAEAHFIDWCDEMLRGTYGLRAKDYRDVNEGKINNIYIHWLSNIPAYAALLYEAGRLTESEFISQVDFALNDWHTGYDDDSNNFDAYVKDTGETESDVCRDNGLHYTAYGQTALIRLCLPRRAYGQEGVAFTEEGFQWDDTADWSENTVQPTPHRAGSFLAPYLQDSDLVNATDWTNGSIQSAYIIACAQGTSYKAFQAPYTEDEMIEKGCSMVIYDSVFNKDQNYGGYRTAYENIESIVGQGAELWDWRPFGAVSKFDIGHMAPFVRQYDYTTTNGGGGGTGASSLEDHIVNNTTGVREHWTLLGADNDTNGFPQGSLNGSTYELDSIGTNVTFDATGAEDNVDAMDLGVSPSYVARASVTGGSGLAAPTPNDDFGFSVIVKLPVGYLPNDGSGDVGDIVNWARISDGKYNTGTGLVVRDDGSLRMVVSGSSTDRSWYTSTETLAEDTFYYITGHYRASDGNVRLLVGEIDVDADLVPFTLTEGSGSVFTGAISYNAIDKFEIGEKASDNSDSLEGIVHGFTFDEAYISTTELNNRYDSISAATTGEDLVRAIDETSHVLETIARSRILNRPITETSHVLETQVRARDLARIEDESSHVLETQVLNRELARVEDEISHVLETIVRNRVMSRAVNDTSHVLETTVRSLEEILVRVIDEAVHVMETTARSRVLNRTIDETSNILETTVSTLDTFLIKVIDETVHVMETTVMNRVLTKVIDETSHILESIVVVVTGDILQAVLVESISLVESVKASIGLFSSVDVEDIDAES